MGGGGILGWKPGMGGGGFAALSGMGGGGLALSGGGGLALSGMGGGGFCGGFSASGGGGFGGEPALAGGGLGFPWTRKSTIPWQDVKLKTNSTTHVCFGVLYGVMVSVSVPFFTVRHFMSPSWMSDITEWTSA